jgi:hypothetical protein
MTLRPMASGAGAERDELGKVEAAVRPRHLARGPAGVRPRAGAHSYPVQ